ncbi:AraC family transcriptional regulator [Paenibacillus sp. D9]|nr:AraC family transcriptional regulator [Paenibacillus sp. D9]KKC45940.1 hypothetical protein VE23_00530 [Paenibacillus sp. D9]
MPATPDHYDFKVSDNPGSVPAAELTVLFSGEGSPIPGHENGPGIHDYVLIHTVTGGKGTFRCGDKDAALSSGDSFAIFPGVLFQYTADSEDPWQYNWVAFRGHAALHLLAEAGITPEKPAILGQGSGNAAELYARLRDSLASGNSASLMDMEASGWLRLLLAEFARLQPDAATPSARSTAAARRQAEQAARWLQTHYAEAVSISELAKALGYHRSHLSKVFRSVTGLSPMQYLQNIRLRRAMALLGTELSVEQVAASCGFSDPLYFSRQFKRSAGCSPSAYRARLVNP